MDLFHSHIKSRATSKYKHVYTENKSVIKLTHIIGYSPSSINLKSRDVSENGSAKFRSVTIIFRVID